MVLRLYNTSNKDWDEDEEVIFDDELQEFYRKKDKQDRGKYTFNENELHLDFGNDWTEVLTLEKKEKETVKIYKNENFTITYIKDLPATIKPELSVIMIIDNDNALEAMNTINSLMKQTYRMFELIAIFNGCDEEIHKTVKEYIEQKPLPKFNDIVLENHVNDISCINITISLREKQYDVLKGDFTTIIKAGIEYLPNFFERNIGIIKQKVNQSVNQSDVEEVCLGVFHPESVIFRNVLFNDLGYFINFNSEFALAEFYERMRAHFHDKPFFHFKGWTELTINDNDELQSEKNTIINKYRTWHRDYLKSILEPNDVSISQSSKDDINDDIKKNVKLFVEQDGKPPFW